MTPLDSSNFGAAGQKPVVAPAPPQVRVDPL